MTDAPVAVLVCTHDHLDDARINMEIVPEPHHRDIHIGVTHRLPAHLGRLAVPGGEVGHIGDRIVGQVHRPFCGSHKRHTDGQSA